MRIFMAEIFMHYTAIGAQHACGQYSFSYW